MKKRQWAIVAGFGVLALSILGFFALKSTPQEKAKPKPASIKGVNVIVVDNTSVPVNIQVDGKINARNKISIFAEVNGVLQNGPKKFEEGVRFKKGETLLNLESSEARSAFLSAKSNYVNTLSQALPDIKLDYPQSFEKWRSYLNEVSDEGSVPAPPKPESKKLNLFLTGRGVFSSYQNLQSSATRLNKYRVTAPFDGIVTESQVDPGILVSPGQRLGEYIEPGKYELEATVGSAELSLINEGDSVQLSSPDSRKKYPGIIYRTNAKVDPQTQQVKIFIRVKGDDLRDGQYMTGTIQSTKVDKAYRLDRKLRYGTDYTYIVKDTTLERASLNVVQKSPSSVIVQGLPDNALLPQQPISGAFEGMKVQIIDTVAQNQQP